jgi:hypothetical protein
VDEDDVPLYQVVVQIETPAILIDERQPPEVLPGARLLSAGSGGQRQGDQGRAQPSHRVVFAGAFDNASSASAMFFADASPLIRVDRPPGSSIKTIVGL